MQEGLRWGRTFLGRSRTSLPPTIINTVATDRSSAGSPSSVPRWIRQPAGEEIDPEGDGGLTLLGSWNHPTQRADGIRDPNDPVEGNASTQMQLD